MGSEGLGDLGEADCGEVVLMVGGVDDAFSVSVSVEGVGEAGFSVSMAVVEGMVAVILERPRCQMNDSRNGQTGNACSGQRVSRGSSSGGEREDWFGGLDGYYKRTRQRGVSMHT